jgi:hypothetical protein
VGGLSSYQGEAMSFYRQEQNIQDISQAIAKFVPMLRREISLLSSELESNLGRKLDENDLLFSVSADSCVLKKEEKYYFELWVSAEESSRRHKLGELAQNHRVG